MLTRFIVSHKDPSTGLSETVLLNLLFGGWGGGSGERGQFKTIITGYPKKSYNINFMRSSYCFAFDNSVATSARSKVNPIAP